MSRKEDEMSRTRFTLAFDHANMVPAAKGVATPKTIYKNENGILLAYGTSVPAAASGYAIGCIFLHDDGGSGTTVYVNEGTATTSDFNALVTNESLTDAAALTTADLLSSATGLLNLDESQLDSPAVDGLLVHRVARATYDVTGGDSGTVASHDLGVALPDNAIVVRASIEVITGFDSAEHDETIALGIASDDAAGILAAADLGSAAYVASIQDDGLAANYSTKTTAERQLIAVVAVHAATAGKLVLWVEYIISA